jgi:hypothetical protein
MYIIDKDNHNFANSKRKRYHLIAQRPNHAVSI